MDKIKDSAYLDFLREKPCIKCGRMPVQMHHEGVIPGYNAQYKNRLDYQALPMCATCHIQIRHGQGYDTFWNPMREGPSKFVFRFLTEYHGRFISERKYDSFEDYEQAISYIEEILDYLQEKQ